MSAAKHLRAERDRLHDNIEPIFSIFQILQSLDEQGKTSFKPTIRQTICFTRWAQAIRFRAQLNTDTKGISYISEYCLRKKIAYQLSRIKFNRGARDELGGPGRGKIIALAVEIAAGERVHIKRAPKRLKEPSKRKDSSLLVQRFAMPARAGRRLDARKNGYLALSSNGAVRTTPIKGFEE